VREKTSTILLSRSEIMKRARSLGFAYEKESHNCPQATRAALMDVFNFRDDTLSGPASVSTAAEETATTGLVMRLLELFKEEYGGIRCRDVHRAVFGREFNVWDEKELEEFLAMGAHEEKCPKVVGNGAARGSGILWDELHSEERIKRTKVT
jgi:hypothetical protein